MKHAEGLNSLLSSLTRHTNGEVLTRRETDILYLYFIEGESLVAIGGPLRLTHERIRQIKEKAIQRLISKIILAEENRQLKANQ